MLLGVEENHPLAAKLKNVNSGGEGNERETDLPNTNDLDEKVTRESRCEHLRHDKDVGSQRRLQHNRHVGGIE